MTGDELRAWRIRNFGEGHGSRTHASVVLGVSRWSEWRFERGDRPIPPSVAHLAHAYELCPDETALLDSLARLWAAGGRRPLAEERATMEALALLRRARARAAR